ncbi:MAG TPA: biotin synthase BioB [Nitrospirae bacterium]|nr:biotin synthase [bacterium BMS3Abin06]HDH11810.1 biotin synthase BioB [Nitrospirota bacterium]HDZ02848.1 biotin synthase BioB [Nitrospirota bacterium]
MLQTEQGTLNSDHGINRDSALALSHRKGAEMYDLFALANRVREKFRGNSVDLCSIINAKSGACPEDCSFCAQSAHNKTDTNVYPLLSKEKILDAAVSAKKNGVKRFCIVTSGKKPSGKELDEICNFISEIRDLGLLPCATLGMLDTGQLRQLKDAGLNRYHHNLETSEHFFSEICTTHTYRDKIKTIEAAKSLELSICSGGIFGLGESWEDRIDMAFALKETGVDSVPLNFFTPIKGTLFGNRELLNPIEALKIIALYRLVLPECEVRVCGGRPVTLRDLHSHIFQAGADGLLIGNYLTTDGRDPEDDLQMIKDLGLEI